MLEQASAVDTIERCSAFKLISLNVENLSVLASGILSDRVLMMVDCLALTHTSGGEATTEVPGFTCVVAAKRADVAAGGVAIYQSDKADIMAAPRAIRQVCASRDVELGLSDACGDICAAEISVGGRRTLLFSLFLSPGTTLKQKKFFLVRNLFMYIQETMPIMVTGNFNINLYEQENVEFPEFMKKYLHLELSSSSSDATTLDGRCVDLTFKRNIQLSSSSYKSCFFKHRPMLSALQ